MIVTGKAVPRRSFLRGMGVAVGLPFLDAMSPALAQTAAAPVRMAMLYVPNGIVMDQWNPSYEGKLSTLPRILKPMEPFVNDFSLLGNLTHNMGRALLDGGGDHGRCCGSYLTGVQPRKTTTDIKAGISFDQIIANKIGHQTRFPSLEVGIEDARQAGNCDSGYSCAYTNNLAWKSENQPVPPILNPRTLFERLFGTGVAMSPEMRMRRNIIQRSILDYVTEDTGKLQRALGPSDKRKLDQYLTSIREIEQQLLRAEADTTPINPGMEKPYGIPSDYAEHFKLMTGMITVALQADQTRICTFLLTREGTSRSYREIGIPDGHHPLTHHGGNPEYVEKVTQINTYHVKQLAAWIEKLKSIQEANGTLLDNMMLTYGAGLADGNRHTHEDLPVLVAGRAGGHFKPGRRIMYRRETPMCNLFLTMMDRMGVPAEEFADATGRLAGLDLA